MSNPLPSLPDSLAGYQNIVCGPVRPGDLVIMDGCTAWYWAEGLIGSEINPVSERVDTSPAGSYFGDVCTYRVYRKMPVAKPGDLDHKWQEIRGQCAALAQPAPTEAATHDAGKPPLAMLPWAGLDQVALVQAFGHKKYHDYFNYKRGFKHSTAISCSLRHLRSHMQGEDNDAESGLPHLAHAVCRLLFLMQNIADKTARDDRYQKPTTQPTCQPEKSTTTTQPPTASPSASACGDCSASVPAS